MANRLILCFLFLICFMFSQPLIAQDGTIRGIISDRQTGEGLISAAIILEHIQETDVNVKGMATDRNGLYEFNRLPPGRYAFTVRYVGYQTFTDTLELPAGNVRITKHVEMVPADAELDEVTILDSGTGLSSGQIRIDGRDVSRIPTPAGSGDLATYLQTQTGVVATGDRGGQLFIRGGTPSENLVLMDGTLIYNPFHIVGFFSVFPADIISSVDLYAGGFGPRYSGRTSSVMDVRLKNGNMYEQKWSASLSPFLSDLYLERPVKEGKSSLIVSLRGSLIQETSNIFLDEQLPLRFNSQLVKYSHSGDHGFNCSALIMRTYDRGSLDHDLDETFSWKNVVAGGRCAGVSEESRVSFIDINLGFSYFTNKVGGSGSHNRFSDVFKSHVDINLLQNIGNIRLDYGFFSNLRAVNHDISERFLNTRYSSQMFLSTGAYVSANIPAGNRIDINPGVVYTSYIQRFKATLEPRLQLAWKPRGREGEEIHAAFGIYSQILSGISDFRDAGTAFTAWMPVPDSGRIMKARHALAGWRQPVGKHIKFSAEGYYKILSNIPVSVWSTIAQFTTDLAYADGLAYGSDIRLDFNRQVLYWGIGYGYSITEYETTQEHFNTWFGEPVQTYRPAHDRRHQVSAQAGLEFEKFSVNISWLYGSGTPYTQPLGFDVFFRFQEHIPDLVHEYGAPRILLDKPYGARLPGFHRLDISAEQIFNVPFGRARVQAGAINLYDRDNVFYYDVFTQKTINQLPVMPYISLKLESI